MCLWTCQTEKCLKTKTCHNFSSGKFDVFLSLLSVLLSLRDKCLGCLTCCDGGRRSHTHTPPFYSGCGVWILPAEPATCPCMSHEPLAAESSGAAWATYHLTRGTTPSFFSSSSSSFLSAEWLTAQPPSQPSPPATVNTNMPLTAHFTWCNTDIHTYIHTYAHSHLRLIR